MQLWCISVSIFFEKFSMIWFFLNKNRIRNLTICIRKIVSDHRPKETSSVRRANKIMMFSWIAMAAGGRGEVIEACKNTHLIAYQITATNISTRTVEGGFFFRASNPSGIRTVEGFQSSSFGINSYLGLASSDSLVKSWRELFKLIAERSAYNY